MKKVLVTGITGFIGGHLAKALNTAGYQVVGLVRDKNRATSLEPEHVELRLGDVTDLHALLRACEGVEAVVHLAAISSAYGADYAKSFQINVVGSQNLADAARANGVRQVVYLGSQSDNEGAYAVTKRQAELVFLNSGLNVAVVTPSLVYGSGSRGLFAGIVRLLKRLPVIPVVGIGQHPVRPVYVGDVAQAVVTCLERWQIAAGKVYYLSGPTTLSFPRFLDLTMEALGLRRAKIWVPYPLAYMGILATTAAGIKLPISVVTLKGLAHSKLHDSTEAERDLDFRALSPEEGLRRTVAEMGGAA